MYTTIFHTAAVLTSLVFTCVILYFFGQKFSKDYYKGMEPTKDIVSFGILITTPLVIYSTILMYSNTAKNVELMKYSVVRDIPVVIDYFKVIKKYGDYTFTPNKITLNLSSPYELCGIGILQVLVPKEGLKARMVGYKDGKVIISFDNTVAAIEPGFLRIDKVNDWPETNFNEIND